MISNIERLEIQSEIIKFLTNRYYHFCEDESEASEQARKDSYKIMGLIIGVTNDFPKRGND